MYISTMCGVAGDGMTSSERVPQGSFYISRAYCTELYRATCSYRASVCGQEGGLPRVFLVLCLCVFRAHEARAGRGGQGGAGRGREGQGQGEGQVVYDIPMYVPSYCEVSKVISVWLVSYTQLWCFTFFLSLFVCLFACLLVCLVGWLFVWCPLSIIGKNLYIYIPT